MKVNKYTNKIRSHKGVHATASSRQLVGDKSSSVLKSYTVDTGRPKQLPAYRGILEAPFWTAHPEDEITSILRNICNYRPVGKS